MNENNYRQTNAKKTLDAVMKILPNARKMGFGDEYVTEVAKYAGASTDKVFTLYEQRSADMMGKGLTPLDLAKAAHNIRHIETNYADRLAFVALIPAKDTADLAENGAIDDIIEKNTAILCGKALSGTRGSQNNEMRYRRKNTKISLDEVSGNEMARIGRRYDPYDQI